MLRNAFITALILFLVTTNSSSQFTNLGNHGIELRNKIGSLIPHKPNMQPLLKGRSWAGELCFIVQTTGNQEWHTTFNYPRFGVSTYFADLGYSDVLGKGLGAYAFFELPLMKFNKWSLNSKIGYGAAYVSRTFDLFENPENIALSTALNSLVVMGVMVNKQFGQSELSFGTDLSHISNGATKMPNLGLNMRYFSLAYTRYFGPLNKIEHQSTDTSINRQWQLYVMGIVSTRQVNPIGGRNYLVGALGVFAHKQFSRKAAMDVGIDFISNQSNKALVSSDVSELSLLQIGCYAGYVLPINRVYLTMGMGMYIKNGINPCGKYYHRFGPRLRLSENWSVNGTIKAHWGTADYFEYGIIYHILK